MTKYIYRALSSMPEWDRDLWDRIGPQARMSMQLFRHQQLDYYFHAVDFTLKMIDSGYAIAYERKQQAN